jgi:hypothetical protein
MDPSSIGVGASLVVLTLLLAALCVRGLWRFRRTRILSELIWGCGLALAAAAMGVESAVFFGAVSSPILEAYVFLSAAIVGILSLGATKVLRRPLLARGYTWYILATCGLLAVAGALTPLSGRMVAGGIITGNPPLLLLVISSFITFPATVVLLTASVVALRRSRSWQTLLLIAGALILGAGGTLYIASFPVALYYAEFVGIILLFFGLISLPHPAAISVATSARSEPG